MPKKKTTSEAKKPKSDLTSEEIGRLAAAGSPGIWTKEEESKQDVWQSDAKKDPCDLRAGFSATSDLKPKSIQFRAVEFISPYLPIDKTLLQRVVSQMSAKFKSQNNNESFRSDPIIEKSDNLIIATVRNRKSLIFSNVVDGINNYIKANQDLSFFLKTLGSMNQENQEMFFNFFKENKNDELREKLSKIRDFLDDEPNLFCLIPFNIKDKEANNALHVAVAKNKFDEIEDKRSELVKLMLGTDVDLRAKNIAGETPIEIAAKQTDVEIAEMLLEKYLTSDLIVEYGSLEAGSAEKKPANDILLASILKYAKEGELEKFRQLFGQTKEFIESAGFKPLTLMIAAKNGRDELVEFLLSDENERATGQTRSIEMVRFVDSVDGGGNTALHHASKNGHIAVVDILLENQADTKVKNKTGKTAALVIGDQNKREIVAAILNFSKQKNGAGAVAARSSTEATDSSWQNENVSLSPTQAQIETRPPSSTIVSPAAQCVDSITITGKMRGISLS